MNTAIIIKANRLAKLLAEEPMHEHAAVLCYEAGAVLEHSKYHDWATEEKDQQVAKGRMISELQDVLAQAWTLAINQGLNPEDLLYDGCCKAVDAIEQREAGQLGKRMQEKW